MVGWNGESKFYRSKVEIQDLFSGSKKEQERKKMKYDVGMGLFSSRRDLFSKSCQSSA